MKRLKRAAQPANEAVHASLRQAILTNLLHPGERLNVAELAAQLHVSLTPVRNAIQLLAAEGLIEVRPRSGTFVARLSSRDVRETFEIRCALECLAAEKSASVMNPVAIRGLRDLLAELRQPIRDEAERAAHERLNIEFHGRIMAAAGNQRLLDAYQALNAHITIARIHAGEIDWRSRLEQEHQEHGAIVDAIAAHDAVRAAAAMRLHIMRACESLAAALEDRQTT
jgi:GntR family transcriptional regulator, rspAB operon transcriptional repressor